MKSAINLMLGALLVAGSLHATAQTVITEENATLTTSASVTVISHNDTYGHYSKLLEKEIVEQSYLDNPTKLKGLELELSSVIKKFNKDELLIFITKIQGELEFLRKKLNKPIETKDLQKNIAIGAVTAIALYLIYLKAVDTDYYYGRKAMIRNTLLYTIAAGGIAGFLVYWNKETTAKDINAVNSQIDSIILTLNALKESALNTQAAESF